MVRINESCAEKLFKTLQVFKFAFNMEQKPKNPWRYILFYYDRADPRILVPKQIPVLGWTLNAAHTISKVILLLLVALIIFAIYTGQAHYNMP